MRNVKFTQALAAALVATTASMVCWGAAAAGAGDILAQAAPPASTEVKPGPPTLRRLFAAADANHDGKLTKEEARGWLPITYESFEKIDVDKRGYITFEQFMVFTQKRVNKQADDILHLYEPASRM